MYEADADEYRCSGVPGNGKTRKIYAWLAYLVRLFDPPEVKKVSMLWVDPVEQGGRADAAETLEVEGMLREDSGPDRVCIWGQSRSDV